MEEQGDVTEHPSDTPHPLRALTRDVIALGALPATWTGREPPAIVESLADALLGMLQAEFVLARLDYPPGNGQEVLRTSGRASRRKGALLQRSVAPLLTAASVGSPLRVTDPSRPGSLSVDVVPLGHQGEYGFLAVGYSFEGLPDDFRRALLGIGVSQVAVALKERQVFERSRADFALRESEERFRSVFDGALDAMAITDDQHQYVEVNAALCTLVGRTRDELIGQAPASVGSLEAAPDRQSLRVFRAAGRASGEWRFRRPDGTTRDVEYQSTADFVPGLHLSVMRDITERKAVGAELKGKTELLQTILDNIPVMIRFTGLDGRVEWVNREWQRVFGWSLEEARQIDVAAELYSEPADQERVRRFMRGETPWVWRDFRARMKDGRILDTCWANVVLSDGRVIGIGQDITDRKRTDVERETRTRQVQMLADTALAIGATTSLSEIARIASSAARNVIGTHAAATSFTLEEDGSRAIAVRSVSDEAEAAGAGPLDLGGSAHGRFVRRTNCPVRIAESGWMGVPLVGRDGRNLGLIELRGRLEGAFSDDDEAIVIQLAQLASGAAENARLLEEVSGARVRLEALSRRLVNLQEEERGAIARELHDEVGQVLTGLKLMLETTKRGGGAELTQPIELSNELLHRVRNLSLNLRPPMLDDLGLVPTLLWHFERYRQQTGIDVRFHHRGVDGRYSGEAEITAFRIVQEALTNVARHASVREAAVELSAEGGSLRIRVEDHGRGFDPHRPPGPARGLTGMRERALLAGGSLIVEARPGTGTQVVGQLPLHVRAPARLAR